MTIAKDDFELWRAHPVTEAVTRALQILAERNKHVLAILGQYMASGIVLEYNVDKLTEEFDVLLQQAQDTFMLSEKDLKAGLSEEALKLKQGAKERTVFNYTVVKFGLRKFAKLLEDIYEDHGDREQAAYEAAQEDKADADRERYLEEHPFHD